MNNSVLIAIIVILCFIILLLVFRRNSKYDGALLIDTSNPEKDIFRLELDTLDGLDKKKTILLKVDSHAQLQNNNE